MRDPTTGNSKGFAFINFASFDASDAAIEAMNGQYLCNRPITISYAFKKDSKGERHGSAAERLLAAQNPLAQTDRPHQLFADAPPMPPPMSAMSNMMGMPPGLPPPPPPPPVQMAMPPPPPPPSVRPVGMDGIPPPPLPPTLAPPPPPPPTGNFPPMPPPPSWAPPPPPPPTGMVPFPPRPPPPPPM